VDPNRCSYAAEAVEAEGHGCYLGNHSIYLIRGAGVVAEGVHRDCVVGAQGVKVQQEQSSEAVFGSLQRR
jgi:hypothetical protein